MAPPRLDWSSAKVRKGELTVQVVGDPPKGWKDSFNSTAALLGGRDRGVVELRKRTAHVHGISPGDEERIRHLLESAIQQANAGHDVTGEDEEHEQADEAGEDGEPSVDDEMTERFRSFASEADHG